MASTLEKGSWIDMGNFKGTTEQPYSCPIRKLYMTKKCLLFKGSRSNISNTRKRVSSDIQTLRSKLKKRGAAEFFETTSRCLDI